MGYLTAAISNPPLNVLNVGVRRGLIQAFERANADVDITAVLLVGSGNNFIAGADVKELGSEPIAPTLPDVCECIHQSSKRVVASLHGAVLGGGLEIAMSAHRVL